MTLGLVMLAQATNGVGSRTIVPQPFQEYAPLLVSLVLLMLALLFFLVTRYTHRLDQTSYLADLFGRALCTIEERQLMAPIQDDWEAGRFHQSVLEDTKWLTEVQKDEKTRQPHPDPVIESDYRVLAAQSELRYNPWGTRRPGPSAISAGAADPNAATVAQYVENLRVWQKNVLHPEARRRHEAALNDKAKEARRRSDTAIGGLDQATLRGRGPEFVLQFTAVVVIIFATISLAILDRLSSEQAGTILAAIAGYVLGQASRRAGAEGGRVVVPSSTGEGERQTATAGGTKPA